MTKILYGFLRWLTVSHGNIFKKNGLLDWVSSFNSCNSTTLYDYIIKVQVSVDNSSNFLLNFLTIGNGIYI